MAETIQPIYHNFDLGFDTEDVKRVEIKQDSDKTHILVIRIYTNDDQMELNPAWDYHITMRKPDGKLVVNTENIEVRNNKIYVTCTAQMLSAPGTSVGELIIYNNSQSLYTNNFYIYVNDDLISGDEVESTDEFNSLVSVLRAIQQYADLARVSQENAATSETSAQTSAENAEEYERQIKAILDSLDGYDDTINQLIDELNNNMSDIEDLRTRVQNQADDIENLLRELQDMGIDQIQQILDNALAIYSNLQTLNADATATAESISAAANNVNSMVSEIETKLNNVNTQYETFQQQYTDFTTKMATIQTFLDNMETMKNQMQQDMTEIAQSKTQAAADTTAISGMREEIEELLEQIREEAQQGAGGFDPIIINPTQPTADEQTKDDMWLQPY